MTARLASKVVVVTGGAPAIDGGLRISVSNWSTDEADVDRSVAAILRCARPAAPVARGAG
jgi:hypothetical protein